MKQNRALAAIQASFPLTDSKPYWSEVLNQARNLPEERGRGESGRDRMLRLRDTLRQELVAFHDKLVVSQSADQSKIKPGARIWDILVPLTLFPQRDRGFSRVECIIEFRNEREDATDFRVVKLLPEERSDVYAQATIGAELQLKADLGMKLPTGLVPGISAAEAVGKLYGKGEAKFDYKAERKCVIAEIVRGTGARWRLDDLKHPDKVRPESHQLQVGLEVKEGTGPIHAAGYISAYSEEQWMTQQISGVIQKLSQAVLSFFKKGSPTEAYAEWTDILQGS